jgi:hypothetical protein
VYNLGPFYILKVLKDLTYGSYYTNLKSIGYQLDFRTSINVENSWVFNSRLEAVRFEHHGIEKIP